MSKKASKNTYYGAIKTWIDLPQAKKKRKETNVSDESQFNKDENVTESSIFTESSQKKLSIEQKDFKGCVTKNHKDPVNCKAQPDVFQKLCNKAIKNHDFGSRCKYRKNDNVQMQKKAFVQRGKCINRHKSYENPSDSLMLSSSWSHPVSSAFDLNCLVERFSLSQPSTLCDKYVNESRVSVNREFDSLYECLPNMLNGNESTLSFSGRTSDKCRNVTNVLQSTGAKSITNEICHVVKPDIIFEKMVLGREKRVLDVITINSDEEDDNSTDIISASSNNFRQAPCSPVVIMLDSSGNETESNTIFKT